jgi:hypothetical protein
MSMIQSVGGERIKPESGNLSRKSFAVVAHNHQALDELTNTSMGL